MSVKQISIYVANENGSLANITKILSDAKIDLKSLCIADTRDYGILRVIVDDTEKALSTLKQSGQTYNVREVVGCAVDNRIGGLAAVVSKLSEKHVNIEYAYSIITSKAGKAYIVMRVDDNETAEEALRETGIQVLTQEDI